MYYKYLLKIHEICDIYEMRKKILLLIRTEVPLWRQLLAEFLGTFVYVLFGNAATAQVFGWNTKNYSLVSWGWGLGMMMAVLVCGTISGAHFNPAVTLALTLVRRFSLFQILLYWIVQFLGSMAAAGLVFAIYFEGRKKQVVPVAANFTNHTYKPASIFAVYPETREPSLLSDFSSEICGTFLLVLCIYAITDRKNARIPKHWIPLFIGIIYTAAGLAFGSNYNTTFNPARDLGLRFVSWAAIRGRASPFKGWYWVPYVGPCIGALAGVLTYIFSIEYFWPRTDNLSLPLTEYDMTHQIIGIENNDPSSYNCMSSFKDVLINAYSQMKENVVNRF